jgi:phosphoribosylformylglycinamidine synthase
LQANTLRYDVWSRQWDDRTLQHNEWVQTAHQLGINTLTGCFVARVFFVKGRLSEPDVHRLGQTLLADTVVEDYALSNGIPPLPLPADHTIEVTLLPGVTDPAAENLVRAAHQLGIPGVEQAATGHRYLLRGDLTDETLRQLATAVFSNPVIQRCEIDKPITPPFVVYEAMNDRVEVIALREIDDTELLRVSAERRLALNLEEMQAVQAYYRQEGRDPTDVEIEMIAQTWSEHCIHKTFRATINYTGPESDTPQTIHGLLRTYIRAATEKVNKPWVRSAFVDNAGIIVFDDDYDLAFKVETHNHPSAIEPFGGANTGVGGVVRDVLGVSARPIANTDILCFGPQDIVALPEGVLHPRRIAEGVVQGVADYGNKMGIPTVNGAILYHPGYTANPLVFCGCLGLLPRNTHPTGARPGDLIVVIGGRTGRDGLRGATFSSMEMNGTTGEVAGSAVQIGHPIQEKRVQEVILQARDARLYSAITDCGAGGLSSAVGEMGKDIGARVQLTDVPLKYPGLRPWESWLSEAQERMVLAVPPESWDALQRISAGQDVEAVCIGEFNSSGRLTLYYGERLVGEMSMLFLHEAIPLRHLDAVWTPPAVETSPALPDVDYAGALLKLLAHPNIASKESVIRRYDHEVQGGMAVKPLVGVANQGPSDASVLVPLDTQRSEGNPKGVAIANGICPQYGEIDPYAMAWAAIDEAVRNLVAVGADPDQIAILDNFCWGNPNLPDRLGSLVRCAQGCYDAALAYGVPFISGKDSLNNEYADAQGQRHAIPGTLLISAVGIVPDIGKSVTMDLKQAGNLLYIIGETHDELGGSHLNLVHGISGGTVPQSRKHAPETMRALHKAIQAGLVQSCHDLSEGGLAVALAEMCLAGRLGADIQLPDIVSPTTLLFSESLARFVLEVAPEDEGALQNLLMNIPYDYLGTVNSGGNLLVQSGDGTLLDLPVRQLEIAWRGVPVALNPRPLLPQGEGEKGVPKVPLHEGEGFRVRAYSPSQTLPYKDIPKPASTLKKVLILHANGTNRDREAALACELAGGVPEIVHINQLSSGEKRLLDYHMLVIPGGFSYGDDMGAGVLWALDLHTRFGDDVARFVELGRPVLGICNGFQALVKAGLLPGAEYLRDGQRSVTLTYNERGRFECRWVYLKANPVNSSLFTAGLDDWIYCPVAHGEGRVVARDQVALDALVNDGLVALTYVNTDGSVAQYPENPNGSALGIAALTNQAGNVMGLMPHPEDHIFLWQHPRWRRHESGMSGLRLFINAIRNA